MILPLLPKSGDWKNTEYVSMLELFFSRQYAKGETFLRDFPFGKRRNIMSCRETYPVILLALQMGSRIIMRCGSED